MKTREYVAEKPATMEPAVRVTGSPLEVSEVKPGLHEKAEGIENRPVYRLCWPRTSRPSLGPVRLPAPATCSGTYVKLSPTRVNLADEAARRYHEAAADPVIEETSVFLRTRLGGSRIDLVLAGRNDGRWSALHRWSDTWRGLGISRLDIVS
jgi:hypothetical protein